MVKVPFEKFTPNRFIRDGFYGLILLVGFSNDSFGTTQKSMTETSPKKENYGRKNIHYFMSIEPYQSKLSLNVSAIKRTITIPEDKFLKRFKEYKSDQRIEPIQLTLSQNDDQVLKIAERLAQPGKKLSLAHNLQQLIPGGEKLPGTDLFTVNLTKESLDLINRQSLDEFFARDHTELVINASSLKQDTKKLTELVKELQPYLTTTDLQTLKSKVSMNENIAVDEFLLPSFAKRMVTKHTIFKGPNCFHAALSFQNQNYPTSAQVNVREEAGYHRSMINYDELWRVVQSEFYEIDVSKVPLQYGDMILFFDVPKEAHTAVDFKTLRHAASYLFNGYIFQKGSKSANSPYVVRTLSDEWATWTMYTKNLGTKVFRRSSPNYRKASLWQSSDWLY